ncbi:DUF1653 domain-containing protein [Butyrivibrio sp. AE2032]|uniref:DUF1653 domain-containing protein n=1 Tax=Butyrivibrio sp. AE2032 TaxID=1458463 RepID=UPI000554905F|nr:DUF1653 domain-containing protein [Butyrivibrio sp. AE2032]
MREKPRPQELYRHFKGNLYQIITTAIDSETREEKVVYQALYGDYKTYVRPLDMFMSEVDRTKYPDAPQKMRFEKVESGLEAGNAVGEAKKFDPQERADDSRTVMPQKADDSRIVRPEKRPANDNQVKSEKTSSILAGFKLDKTPPKQSAVMSKTVDEEAQELNLNPLVIEFMDADLAVDKNDILSKLRPVITNDMIDIMAMDLGVVINEGDVYDRFNDLRNCLTTMEKYESTRLR